MSFDTSYQNTGLLQRAKGGFAPCRSAPKPRSRWHPQSSSPFEKGGRTPTLNFNSGALPQTPHSPCGKRGKLFAFPSARECVAPLRQGTGSIFSGEKISTLKPLTAFSLFSELKKISKNVEFYRRLSESRAKHYYS